MRTRESHQREIAPTVCAPTLSRGGTCGARIWRGPAELASLKQLLALIRQILRSSAHTEGGERGPIPPSLRSAIPAMLSEPRQSHAQRRVPGTRTPNSPPLAAPRSGRFGGSGLALFERSEFSQTPPIPSTAGCPKRSAGSQTVGAISFSLVFGVHIT